MRLMTWVLGAALTAAPAMYAQSAQDQQPQQPPASAQDDNTQPSTWTMQPGSAADQRTIYGTGLTPTELKQLGYTDNELEQMRTDSQAMIAAAGQPNASMLPQSDQSPSSAQNSSAAQNANNMPQSDQGAQSASNASDQSMVYGTGMTTAELKQLGYTDTDIAQMRSDSQSMMASNGSANASNNQGQASGTSGVSQPSDMNSNASAEQPQKAETNNHAGLWGLLGLLGLLGLAGRSRRQVVVRHDSDVVSERDRARIVADRDAAEHAAREREIIAASDYRNQDIVSERVRDAVTENEVQRKLRERELQDRRVREIRDEDRKRRRIA